MSPPQFHPPESSALKGKVVVLTGGAAGMGAATVRLLHKAGAHVCFGDVQDLAGQKLEDELNLKSSSTIRYVHCDVSSYSDNLRLFEIAFQAFGRIDHALANAGIVEQGNIFDPNLTLSSVQHEPVRSMSVIDINLKGPIYFARVASVYLRQGNNNQLRDKSLTFTSSVGGFREDPGLWVYVPSKHGVQGLVRTIRKPFSKEPFNIRTNAVCPWATFTDVFAGTKELWEASGLPYNTPEDIAKIIVGVLADSSVSGAAMYVEGGRAWEVEEGIRATRPLWLGERQATDLDRGTEVLGTGEAWVSKQKK